MESNRRALLLSFAALAAGAAAPSAQAWPSLSLPSWSWLDRSERRAAERPRARAPQRAFPEIDFATWDEGEPDYLLYPGDELEIQTPTAPELNRTVRVAPDGRITMPMIGAVMVADRSLPETQAVLSQAYSTQLLRPVVEVNLKQASALKVFVGGEVGNPGVYDMPGDIDALQAVIMAGGFRPSAKRGETALIRRSRQGGPMMRRVDLKDPMAAEQVALRRFDIIYVPRSGIAEVGAFMSQIRDALPIGFSYSLNNPYQQ